MQADTDTRRMSFHTVSELEGQVNFESEDMESRMATRGANGRSKAVCNRRGNRKLSAPPLGSLRRRHWSEITVRRSV